MVSHLLLTSQCCFWLIIFLILIAHLLLFFCYLLGTCVSFVLAKRYVFQKGWLNDKPTIEFFAYFLGGVIGAVITALMFILLIKIGVENILLQKVIASIFSFITVFIYRNFYVFKK